MVEAEVDELPLVLGAVVTIALCEVSTNAHSSHGLDVGVGGVSSGELVRYV